MPELPRSGPMHSWHASMLLPPAPPPPPMPAEPPLLVVLLELVALPPVPVPEALLALLLEVGPLVCVSSSPHASGARHAAPNNDNAIHALAMLVLPVSRIKRIREAIHRWGRASHPPWFCRW